MDEPQQTRNRARAIPSPQTNELETLARERDQRRAKSDPTSTEGKNNFPDPSGSMLDSANPDSRDFFQDFSCTTVATRPVTAACTIISKNYLSFARTLADSLRKFHPDVPLFVLLVDRVDGYFKPENERFYLVGLNDLDIPNLSGFCFKYTILELNTAVKPYFLKYLFQRHGITKLLYFDPDILILENLSLLFELLKTHAIVLTPHLTAPIEDHFSPGELEILRAGTYNLGFIGVSNTTVAENFIEWWEKRLYDQCEMAPERGMHVDQKWIDLVPGLFDDVYILREPGYNVAYWNLHSRRVHFEDDKVRVNNQPCYFFHFSGFDPLNISTISKHQDRFGIDDVGAARRLFESYRDLLLANQYRESRRWPYAFDRFGDGTIISDSARSMYRALGSNGTEIQNPFFRDSISGLLGPYRRKLWRHQLYREFLSPLERSLKPLLKKTLGRNQHLWNKLKHIRRTLLDAGPPIAAGRHQRIGFSQLSRDPGKPFGVNLAGYFGSETGVGEAGRGAARAVEESGLPCVLNNVSDPGSVNMESDSKTFADENPYRFNLIHVNADQVPVFANQMGSSYFAGRYNIGYWFWEISRFPEVWQSSFDYFDELWVATGFVQDALARVSPIPVIRMPVALSPELETSSTLQRADFGISSELFLFLFIFDFGSVMERKNPLGLVQAFQSAFRPHENTGLVIKVVHSDQYPAEAAALRKACEGSRVTIIDRLFGRLELNTLLSHCDSYVSLHRSEGFGVTIAEAMSMAKPVIVTGYSGNMDFTTPANSLLVKYRLAELEHDYGPYQKGSVWAEPDIEHAAELMRYVYENRKLALDIGQRGKADVLRMLNPEAVGKQLKDRLIRVCWRTGHKTS